MEEKKIQLCELIKGSLSFDEVQKKALFSIVDKLSAEEIDKAIEVFLWEAEKNIELAKEQERILKVMKDFADDKRTRMDENVGKLLKKIEKKQKDEDIAESEKLLNS